MIYYEYGSGSRGNIGPVTIRRVDMIKFIEKTVLLSVLIILVTGTVIFAEQVTLSTIMPSSASNGIKKIYQGTITNPTAANNTVMFSSGSQPNKDKSLIIVSGGGLYYYNDRFSEKFHVFNQSRLVSYTTSGNYITSIVVSARPTTYLYTNGNEDASWAIIEYL
jgi:hypothetical protein